MRGWLFGRKARIRFSIAAAIAFVLLYALHFAPVVGNDNKPKQMLLRLEDVGPGGQYEGPEQLGKLRAVLDLLKERGVRFQIAVIPRWVNIGKDGKRYDVSIDQLDNEYVRSFVSLLQDAARSGAVVGMHGYTHQVGGVFRDDGQHESGIGNEFFVPDAGETMTPQFASQRVEEAAETFRRAGLFPYFWEAPHYHTLPEQDAVFRNYFGLHFQADMQANRNALHPQYSTARNAGDGAPSLGAVNVPTPLSYIPYNRDVDIIMNQLGKSDKLPAFFFHPFLEFRHLIPVTDDEGNPVVRDGLPLYRYPDAEKSHLQRLLPRLAEKGYGFISLTDFIPFVPAHSVKVGTSMEGAVETADVTGDGQADVVVWDRGKGEIVVRDGQFRGLRNEESGPPRKWCDVAYGKGDVWTLLDDDGDGKSDLWVMRSTGAMESYRSQGDRFVPARTWRKGKQGWTDMYALRRGPKEWVIAGEAADGSQLESFSLRQGELTPLAPRAWDRKFPVRLTVGDLDGDGRDTLLIPFPHSSRWIELIPDTEAKKWKRSVLELDIPTGENGTVKVGDFNGDGKDDVLFWDAEEKRFAVYRQTDPMKFELLSRMGPWGHSTGELFVCDMNGDGKKDVAELANDDSYLDTALSFQSKTPFPAESRH
ncbi:DUF2334 domain-containing protein [Paenibacillus flagellatus]|uniref:DUF2334 domain-containing protein n=1 Tax=Paenibacillus flagellatus TaxID=2211139 RepID=A0A2V5K560_9BACL|nr:DUF2334 domain-containing protein [Paenibacillus flagellatus]PYI54461.1 hypothetical protein DLM86_13415 [Paenibacillus flagellatus]